MQTVWLSPTDYVTGEPSLEISYPFVSHPETIITSKSIGDFKWISMSLRLPENVSIEDVTICYGVSNARSFISQIRLAEMRTPNQAFVIHDDGTHLQSIQPTCYTSRVGGKIPAPGNTVTLELRLNFHDPADEIRLGAVGIAIQPPVIVPSYPRASLPPACNAGSLARVIDDVRGLWMDTDSIDYNDGVGDRKQWFGVGGEIVNVREFGAKGDAVTDDTAAIQAAIDAASATSQHGNAVPYGDGLDYFGTQPILDFGTGVYLISRSLSLAGIAGWLHVRGDRALLVPATYANGVYTYLDNVDIFIWVSFRTFIEGLTFRRGRNAISIATGNVTSDIRIKNCAFSNTKGTCIFTDRASPSTKLLIDDCYFDINDTTARILMTAVDDCTFSNCTVMTNCAYTFQVSSPLPKPSSAPSRLRLLKLFGGPGSGSVAWVKNGLDGATLANIASSTNATPIVITTSAPHSINVGDKIGVANHAINTNANGQWVAGSVTRNTVVLNGSVGNGVGGATGTVVDYTAGDPTDVGGLVFADANCRFGGENPIPIVDNFAPPGDPAVPDQPTGVIIKNSQVSTGNKPTCRFYDLPNIIDIETNFGYSDGVYFAGSTDPIHPIPATSKQLFAKLGYLRVGENSDFIPVITGHVATGQVVTSDVVTQARSLLARDPEIADHRHYLELGDRVIILDSAGYGLTFVGPTNATFAYTTGLFGREMYSITATADGGSLGAMNWANAMASHPAGMYTLTCEINPATSGPVLCVVHAGAHVKSFQVEPGRNVISMPFYWDLASTDLAGLGFTFPMLANGAHVIFGNVRVYAGTAKAREPNAVFIDSAPPTEGRVIQGDRIYSSSPAAGGAEGWICTTSGAVSATVPANGRKQKTGDTIINTGVVYECVASVSPFTTGTNTPPTRGVGTTNLDGNVTWFGRTKAVFKTFGTIAS